ncbi:DUF3515 domain-containing protein [Streptomyces gamaensis]|uniref:DUF3515 domain-containing protein n=1 Tax=Streptomyces gamaensis TaxID=1763542 RepID=A0ABW0YVD8_9ACTN
MIPPRRRPSLLCAALALTTAAGCASAEETAARPAPHPTGRQAQYCRALAKELPDSVGGLPRRTPSREASEFTAAWGRPGKATIVLRCGGDKPAVLTPDDARYDPYGPRWEVAGIDWMPEQQPDGGVRCTATRREAWVEVTVPREYTGEGGGLDMLTGVSEAIRNTVPFGQL